MSHIIIIVKYENMDEFYEIPRKALREKDILALQNLDGKNVEVTFKNRLFRGPKNISVNVYKSASFRRDEPVPFTDVERKFLIKLFVKGCYMSYYLDPLSYMIFSDDEIPFAGETYTIYRY